MSTVTSPDVDPLPETPRVSVVITTYNEEIYEDFRACVESILDQTYQNLECLIVSENDTITARIQDDIDDPDDIIDIVAVDGELNLASARNLGATHATGDIVAFIDDDAVADPDWVSELVAGYTNHDALAVGGKLTADWCAPQLTALPEEFYWLVGVTHRGFRTDAGPTRNTFGANISFRTDVFETLGQFDTEFGKDHGANLQGEETELCARMQSEFGAQLYYTPDAVVAHKVYDWQMSWRWLTDRAFWQGYTKRLLETRVADSTDEETEFLAQLATESLPRYMRQTLTTSSLTPLVTAVALLWLTGVVGVGYLVGWIALLRHTSDSPLNHSQTDTDA